MTKWEYLYLIKSHQAYHSLGDLQSWKGHLPDYKELKDVFEHVDQAASLLRPDISSQLGELGWELVAVDESHYIFKRPRST